MKLDSLEAMEVNELTQTNNELRKELRKANVAILITKKKRTQHSLQSRIQARLNELAMLRNNG